MGNRKKISNDGQVRDSGIELLKIFAVAVIVISHVVQTLTSVNLVVPYREYVVDITKPSADLQQIILLIFRHFGVWGNSLFFVSSAWFMLKAKEYNKQRWWFLFLEIWTVSIIILGISYYLLRGEIADEIITKSLFPTLYGNNWYMTCYLLFWPISPILNRVVRGMGQRELFRSALVLTILYLFLGFIKNIWFFPSSLILWVTIYLVMGYMQKYMPDFANDSKKNCILALVNAVGFVGVILIAKIGGLHTPFLAEKIMNGVNNCNPFIIFMSIAMFNIARNIHFKSKVINYLSSLSLLVYIIHENLIVRTYFRPAMWQYVYTQYGYTHIIRWVCILAGIVFVLAMFAASLYSVTLQMVVKKASGSLYRFLGKIYMWVEDAILKKMK